MLEAMCEIYLTQFLLLIRYIISVHNMTVCNILYASFDIPNTTLHIYFQTILFLIILLIFILITFASTVARSSLDRTVTRSHYQRDILYLRIILHSLATFLGISDTTRLLADDISLNNSHLT